jgi:hypothetical protein
MHDIDRTFMEAESFEYEAELTSDGEVLTEGQLQELASELLAVTNEQELDQFLGGLMKKAAGAVGKFVNSGVGKQLGGVLKGMAKKALPIAGGVVGNMLLPGVGGAIGSNLAGAAGSLFGLELEGLTEEDREFEVAKQYVRLATEATKNAVTSPAANGARPAAIKQAVAQAAQKYAPGLLQGGAEAGRITAAGASGRWVRRGDKIVLYGV